MEDIIKIENVSKEFDENVVLDNVNISFQKGKVYGIVGRNGSGKTLLLKLICGLEEATSGKVLVEGKKVKLGNMVHIGALIESPGYLPGYSGYGYLKAISKIRNVIGKDEIRKTMVNVGLDPEDRKKIADYSMGMKQRLGIAQAIMEGQSIILLDEPFNGIDDEGAEDIIQIILDLKKQGKTIILTGHYAEEAEQVSDKIIKMSMGKIVD